VLEQRRRTEVLVRRRKERWRSAEERSRSRVSAEERAARVFCDFVNEFNFGKLHFAP
jgi:hypothetical protein